MWLCFRAYHVVVSTEAKAHENEQLLNEERSVMPPGRAFCDLTIFGLSSVYLYSKSIVSWLRLLFCAIFDADFGWSGKVYLWLNATTAGNTSNLS